MGLDVLEMQTVLLQLILVSNLGWKIRDILRVSIVKNWMGTLTHERCKAKKDPLPVPHPTSHTPNKDPPQDVFTPS